MHTRRLRCRSILAVVISLATSLAVVGPSEPTIADGPVELVLINAVVGPERLDVYLDGSLLVGGLGFGELSAVTTVADADEHRLALFRPIASPPAAESARTDEPLPPAEFFGLGGLIPGDTFPHPATPAVVVRIATDEVDGDWGVFEEELPQFEQSCSPGRVQVGLTGSADVLVEGVGTAGRGVFGGGVSTRIGAPRLLTPTLHTARSQNFEGEPEPQEFRFGTFDFGPVLPDPFTVVTYFSHGAVGSYGAAEVVYDCASQRITSARTATRAPVFDTTRFVPVDPVRLFDTRTPQPPTGLRGGDSTLDVQVAGAAGLPANVSAVVLNVTATETVGPGFVTVSPTGGARPSTSSLNVSRPGETIPNLVTVPVGQGGQVSFYTLGGLHLLADVAGYFVDADTATAGRFVPLPPDRMFDTREPPAPAGAIAAGGTLRHRVAGSTGVPSSGVSAVVMNLTAIGLGPPGFVTAFPAGTTRPNASNVNHNGLGDVSPNLVIVPLGDDGSIDLFTQQPVDLVGDVFGYFTDDTAASSASGLFVPTSPLRLDDTRELVFRNGTFVDQFVSPGTSFTSPVAGFGDIPDLGVAAALANVTATGSAAPGFITVWPSETNRPLTSSLNLNAPGATRPNAVIAPLGGPGDLSIFSQSGSHAIVDVFGYFLD